MKNLKNLKKAIAAIVMALVVTFGSVMPSFAATTGVGDDLAMLQWMPDGNLFDPSVYISLNWYQYPELNTMTSVAQVYQHYLTYGKPNNKAAYGIGKYTIPDYSPELAAPFDPNTLVGKYASRNVDVFTLTLYGNILVLEKNNDIHFLQFDHRMPEDPSMAIYHVTDKWGKFEQYAMVMSDRMCFYKGSKSSGVYFNLDK